MKSKAMLLLLMSAPLLSGCTIGPKVERQTVYVNKNDSKGQPVKVGRIAENARLKVELVTESGELVDDEIDVGGWDIIPPKENKGSE